VAQGVPGTLRPRIFLTFGTMRAVVRQPYAPAAFTPGEIPGTHFQGLSRPQGTWFRRGQPRKKSPVTPPIDPGTSRLVAHCLNHYATPGPLSCKPDSISIPSRFVDHTSLPLPRIYCYYYIGFAHQSDNVANISLIHQILRLHGCPFGL
jgi:hypothetical protein